MSNSVDSSKIKKVSTVLILGNSIVRHAPRPEVGWTGDWGMAASVQDSDFVHVLIHHIKKQDSSVVIRFRNIADFEREFVSYNLSQLDSLKSPDMLILRISENVDESKINDSNFISYYEKLIKHIDPNGKALKVIVDGFWDKPLVNEGIRQYAVDNKFAFISTTDLSKDTTNKAGSRFSDAGVANHPSDRGMRLIAERIWDYIKVYF